MNASRITNGRASFEFIVCGDRSSLLHESSTAFVPSGQSRALPELDERFPSLERRDDLRQLRVKAAQQFDATSIADSHPHNRRALMEDAVHGEVLVLGHDHGSQFSRLRANPTVRSLL